MRMRVGRQVFAPAIQALPSEAAVDDRTLDPSFHQHAALLAQRRCRLNQAHPPRFRGKEGEKAEVLRRNTVEGKFLPNDLCPAAGTLLKVRPLVEDSGNGSM